MCGLSNVIVSHATFILLDVITVALYSQNKLVVPTGIYILILSPRQGVGIVSDFY